MVENIGFSTCFLVQDLAVAALVLVVVAVAAVQQRLTTRPLAMEAFLAEAEAVPLLHVHLAGKEETPVVVVEAGMSTPVR